MGRSNQIAGMVPWRILFLDVDGVLNHAACPEWTQGSSWVLDMACVERIKLICRAATEGLPFVHTSFDGGLTDAKMGEVLSHFAVKPFSIQPWV
jgi:hypothetical protein